MKHLIPILLLTLTACKEVASERNESSIQYGIKDVWEYYNLDANCTGAEVYGDSTGGCLKYFQLTRFNDGTSYYSCSAGAPASIGFYWSGFSSGSTFTDEFYITATVRLKISGSTSADTPSVLMYYDNDSDYADTAALSVSLTEVY